ncbi:MAG: Cytochrome b-c1 complex subunit 7 [Ramalina farinacea]|uniref:Cytochrome b-c1 complex subunit 7 n=1 Tax=Ramalina farinacea TaxID=258253 RepID=A0AA43TUN5_9LECA|nr:Cytochrome b-c1 complex subunit 7 [Ramalina farinacea]
MSAPSLTKFIIKRPWLQRWMMPLANWYADAAGYRKLGLRADDLIPEENDTVLLALKRLPPKESYDRVFRLRRAFQCSLAHQLLPKDQQTPPEEDYPYLSPIIQAIEAESKERDDLEAMVVGKRKAKA